MNISPSVSSSLPRPAIPGDAVTPRNQEGPSVVDGQVLDRHAPTRGAVVDMGGGLFYMGEVVTRALNALGKSLRSGVGSSPVAPEASEDPLDDARLRLRELDRSAIERSVLRSEERSAGVHSTGSDGLVAR